MKLILLVLLVAFATAKLGKFNYNLPLELLVNIIKTIMPLPKYIFIDNSLQDVKRLEALKDNIVAALDPRQKFMENITEIEDSTFSAQQLGEIKSEIQQVLISAINDTDMTIWDGSYKGNVAEFPDNLENVWNFINPTEATLNLFRTKRAHRASKALLADKGLTKEGFDLPLINCSIKYISPLLMGDKITIESIFNISKSPKINVQSKFLNEKKKILTTAEVNLVLINNVSFSIIKNHQMAQFHQVLNYSHL